MQGQKKKTYGVQWNPALRTPIYMNSFVFPPDQKLIYIFSKITRVIRTPVNTEIFLRPESQSSIYHQSCFTDTVNLRTQSGTHILPMRT